MAVATDGSGNGEASFDGASMEVETVRAEAEADCSRYRALGEAMRMVTETPGMQELLQGLGKVVGQKGETERARLAHEHAERTQVNDLNAKLQARRDRIALAQWIGVLLAGVIVMLLFINGVLDKSSAAIIGSLLLALGASKRVAGTP